MRRLVVATLMSAVVVVVMAPPTPAAEHHRSPAATVLRQPAAAGPAWTSPPPSSYFGVHYGGIGSGTGYPESSAIGSVRLWDTGTSWRNLEPSRGIWRWDVLDTAVDNAQAHGDSVLYVLGWGPSWALQPTRAIGGHRSLIRRGSPPGPTRSGSTTSAGWRAATRAGSSSTRSGTRPTCSATTSAPSRRWLASPS